MAIGIDGIVVALTGANGTERALKEPRAALDFVRSQKKGTP
jgi:hypothetical protein